jgi:hypothetical protein
MKEFNSHPTTGLQLRRAVSIQAEGTRLLEKHAIAPSAARLCSAASTLRVTEGSYIQAEHKWKRNGHLLLPVQT